MFPGKHCHLPTFGVKGCRAEPPVAANLARGTHDLLIALRPKDLRTWACVSNQVHSSHSESLVQESSLRIGEHVKRACTAGRCIVSETFCTQAHADPPLNRATFAHNRSGCAGCRSGRVIWSVRLRCSGLSLLCSGCRCTDEAECRRHS